MTDILLICVKEDSSLYIVLSLVY